VTDISVDEHAVPSLDKIVDILRSSTAFDLTVESGAPHDLLEHSLQTAEILRRSHPHDVELQIAGLVHDIGHMLPPFRDETHATVAATFVRPILGEKVAELVRLHVPAKRYLVTTDPFYREGLDGGSTVSLERQGGDMSSDEVRDFESEPLCATAIVLRRADEAGKVPGLAVPGLDTWVTALRSHNLQP
jgi:predicted HD phosphohydrolase